jgi:hypothetical protein
VWKKTLGASPGIAIRHGYWVLAVALYPALTARDPVLSSYLESATVLETFWRRPPRSRTSSATSA